MLNESAFIKWKPCEGDDTNPHPTEVCEPLNLACTSLPSLLYNLSSNASDSLSTLQVETIRRIFQSFSIRGGFLLGDATGVGKGRTIAGVLYESKARDKNFKALWISANTRLKADAEREISTLCPTETMKPNVLFTSYTSLLQTKHFGDCLAFLNSKSDDKIIILDECHQLRNNSVSSQSIQQLIALVPNVNVLYSSATAASSSKHLQYLEKLNLWGDDTPFPSYICLSNAIKTYGTPLMELLSIHMRSKGAYVSRQLSFSNVVMEHKHIKLTRQETEMYDACTQLLREHHIIGGSSHQNFFQKLITGLKTKYAIQIAKERLQAGDSVVISLINTGEAFAKRALKADKYNSFQKTKHHKVCEDVLDELGEDIEDMPINPIDEIIDAFGCENVAELTGRSTTFRRSEHGNMEAYSKGELSKEAQKFQEGEKNIAILSRAGGVGISLHDNLLGRRRSHIILEMPWSAEDFMQQLGRTHRSNSLTAPYYILLSTNIPSEMRFASAIVHKLTSMGALIRGDRSCCDFNWLNVPKWSTSTRRSLGLYLAAGRAYHHIPKAMITDMNRYRALAVCGYTGKHTAASEINVKTKLTRLLYEHQDDYELVSDYLSAAKSLYPQDMCSLLCKWTPETHKYFPLPFKDRTLALLLCHGAWETRRTLGMLPDVILHLIIEMMSAPATVYEASVAAERFAQHSLKLHDLSKVQTDTILNRLLGMEIFVQKAITSFTSFIAYPKVSASVSCFLHYIQERSGHSITSEITDIRLASFSEGAKGVQIILSHSPKAIEDPGPNTRIWRHERSGRTVWIRNNHMISSDGVTMHLDDPSDMCLRSKGYSLTQREDWETSVRRNALHTRRKCRKLACHYYIATDNAMNCWETSLHRVLRIPPCVQFPNGLIGLLVFIGA